MSHTQFYLLINYSLSLSLSFFFHIPIQKTEPANCVTETMEINNSMVVIVNDLILFFLALIAQFEWISKQKRIKNKLTIKTFKFSSKMFSFKWIEKKKFCHEIQKFRFKLSQNVEYLHGWSNIKMPKKKKEKSHIHTPTRLNVLMSFYPSFLLY